MPSVSDAATLEEVTDYTTANVTGVVKAPDGGIAIKAEEKDVYKRQAAAQPAQVNPCIRCGRCVEYCPMGLEPVEDNQAYAARDVQELGKLHADYCFNCGSCSFVCPAKRPVTQMMSLAKAFYLGEIKKGGNK